MSMPTFFVEEGFAADSLLTLAGKEAWHALGVRRLDVGDPIRLIDGKGNLAIAKVAEMQGRSTAVLKLGDVTHVPPQQPDIILATAIAKGDRQATLLDMATQLGISAWQPLACERSVSKAGKNSYQRWSRICLEACKQSGSAWLPQLLTVADPEQVVKREIVHGRDVLLAHPDGDTDYRMGNEKIMLMIGPEGGFTDTEVQRIVKAGARKVSLGQNILRIETAAVSLLARIRLDRNVTVSE